MTATEAPFYLIIGSTLTESVKSRLTASGRSYVWKHLRSRPENWHRIAELLSSSKLVGVIATLTAKDYCCMLRPDYAAASRELFTRMGSAKHLVLVHEAVAGSPPTSDDMDSDTESRNYSEWTDQIARDYFGEVDPEIRSNVHGLFDESSVTVTTYKRNAEAAIIASSFVEDLQDNLLFRIYVPSGRIYEEELAQLLSIFHHWLGAVKGARVRQGGYQTSSGRIIELYGDGTATPGDINREFTDFRKFLNLVEDRQAARAMLLGLGVETDRVDNLIGRYARDARRVLLDARHERDRRLLAIQQQLEVELSEEDLPVSVEQLARLVESLVPTSPTLSPLGRLGSSRDSSPPTSNVVINNQFVARVEGVVTQNLTGDVHYGTPLDDLLDLIRANEGSNDLDLEVAARQVADTEAPASTRITARQQLKSFLLRNARCVEQSTFQLIWDWLENQVGM